MNYQEFSSRNFSTGEVIARAALNRNFGGEVPYELLAPVEGDCSIIDPALLGVTGITPKDVVVDSALSLEECFAGISPRCSDQILAAQEMINVHYWGSDQKLHRGQLVVHCDLKTEVQDLFRHLLDQKIEIHSVIPITGDTFRRDGAGWSDEVSMESNNSSGFNFRGIAQSARLSLHALGLAIDFNPRWNPCFTEPIVHIESDGTECAAGYRSMAPSNGSYNLMSPTALHSRHPLVHYLTSRGYVWGGNWADPKDLHHFQRVPDHLKDTVADLRSKGVPTVEVSSRELFADPFFAKVVQIYSNRVFERIPLVKPRGCSAPDSGLLGSIRIFKIYGSTDDSQGHDIELRIPLVDNQIAEVRYTPDGSYIGGSVLRIDQHSKLIITEPLGSINELQSLDLLRGVMYHAYLGWPRIDVSLLNRHWQDDVRSLSFGASSTEYFLARTPAKDIQVRWCSRDGDFTCSHVALFNSQGEFVDSSADIEWYRPENEKYWKEASSPSSIRKMVHDISEHLKQTR